MFYEHERRWFTTGNNFEEVLKALMKKLGEPLTKESVSVVFLEYGVRYLKIERDESVDYLLNIKNKILPEAYIESNYAANESMYLTDLSNSKLLPSLFKVRHGWDVSVEGRLINIFLDSYGNNDFIKVKIVERNSARDFSDFIRNYNVPLKIVTDVTEDVRFRDTEIAMLLYDNSIDRKSVV